MKNKKRVLIASSLSCAILLLSAATTQANSAHKDSQDQNKKEHVISLNKKTNVMLLIKIKIQQYLMILGKTVKSQNDLKQYMMRKQIYSKIYNSTLSMIQLMTRMYYLLKNKAQFIQI